MPRLFDTRQFRGAVLRNRVVVSPMCQTQTLRAALFWFLDRGETAQWRNARTSIRSRA